VIRVGGVRRLGGLVAAATAAVAVVVSVVFAVQALAFQWTTAEAVGEVVAVHPVPDDAGAPQPDKHVVVVEYPDRNGQFRRFDQQITGTAPEKNAELFVRYRMGPPVEARLANLWWLWRPATIASGGALIAAMAAEEALRNRRRLSASGMK